MNKKIIIITTSLVLFVLVIFFFPFSIPLTVDTPGKVLSEEIWLLEKGQDGNITATIYNNKVGHIGQYFSTLPERGDTFQFDLIQNNATSVSQGDTIAIIRSNLLSQQFAEVQKNIELSKARLEILLSGKKESLIQEAEQKLKAAGEEYSFLVKSAERKKELFQKGLLAIEDYEKANSEMRLGLIDMEAKEAKLESIKSGAKAEEIMLVKNEIDGYAQEYDILNEKLSQLIITSPINGDKKYFFSSDTILSVQTTEKVLMIPLKWEYQSLVNLGISGEIFDEQNTAFEVIHFNPDVVDFNSEQVVTLIVKPSFEENTLPANLWIMCQLDLGDVSLIDYLKWKLLYTFKS